MNKSKLRGDDLVNIVKIARQLRSKPASSDADLARGIEVEQSTISKLKDRVEAVLDTPAFKEDFYFNNELLWGDIRKHEVGRAKKAFPGGKAYPQGMTQAGFNLADAADLFLSLCEIAAKADKPLGELLHDYDRFKDSVGELAQDIRRNPSYFNPRNDDENYREPARPWQYPMHALEALNWSWPDPIPEAWHQSVRAKEVAAGKELKPPMQKVEPEPTEDDMNAGLGVFG